MAEIITPVLAREAAHQYWGNLNRAGVTNVSPTGEQMTQFGHPVELPSLILKILEEAAKRTRVLISTEIREKGVTGLTKNRVVGFGPHTINNEDINRQLEDRLANEYRLPLVFDTLVAIGEDGKADLRVLELQTVTNSETRIVEMYKAAGRDPEDVWNRPGDRSPRDIYTKIPERLSGCEHIVVMDLDPFDSTRVDKVGIQQMIGGEDMLPISPFDIEKDEGGYYYYPYIPHPTRPFDVLRDENHRPVKDKAPSKKEYIKHVWARMGQPEFTDLWEKVKSDPEKVELLYTFFNDPSINWIWHPAWQHIADKGTLPIIRRGLEAYYDNPGYPNMFVPVYEERDLVEEPGRYYKKPVDAHQGEGQEIILIEPGRPRRVENGFILQKEIVHFPVDIVLPGKLAAPLRPNTPQGRVKSIMDRQRHPAEQRVEGGLLEVRIVFPPYVNYNSDSWGGDNDDTTGRFMARFAPPTVSPNSHDLPQTNAGAIRRAVWNHIGPNGDHRLYPYGISPVVGVGTGQDQVCVAPYQSNPVEDLRKFLSRWR